MKNKLFLLLLLMITFSFQMKAQSPKVKKEVPIEKTIIGTWKVVNVHLLLDKVQPEQKEKLDQLKKAFLVSKFTFKADRNFSFEFQFREMEVKKGHWKYNSETHSMIIQEWKDKDTDMNKLMEVVVKRENGKVMFKIPETFFELEMKKL